MGFRTWLCKQLFGYDPEEFRHQVVETLDVISSEVASMKELTDMLAQLTPPTEWTEGITNAVVNMDKTLKNFKMTLESHQECLQHIMISQDPDVTVTEWGLIRNEEDSN